MPVGRLLLATCAVAAAFAAALLAPAQASASSDTVVASGLEDAVVKRINAVRKSRGLRTLAVRAPLKRAARDHTLNMARNGYFSHSWSNGAPFGTWIKRYWPGSAGENLYWSSPSPTAAQVVTAWMRSPGHRANLLNRSWRAIGVGVVRTQAPNGAYAGVRDATIVAAELGYRS